jgi:hypothetical protein
MLVNNYINEAKIQKKRKPPCLVGRRAFVVIEA